MSKRITVDPNTGARTVKVIDTEELAEEPSSLGGRIAVLITVLLLLGLFWGVLGYVVVKVWQELLSII